MKYTYRLHAGAPEIGFDSLEELRKLPALKPYVSYKLAYQPYEKVFLLYYYVTSSQCVYIGQLNRVDGLGLPECFAYQWTCWSIKYNV